MSTLPPPSTATPSGNRKLALVPGPASPLKPNPPFPATVVMTPHGPGRNDAVMVTDGVSAALFDGVVRGVTLCAATSAPRSRPAASAAQAASSRGMTRRAIATSVVAA